MERKLREEDKARRREEDNQHCPTEVIGGKNDFNM